MISILIQFIAEPVVSLFTSDGDAILAGGQYLRGYIWDCFFAGIHFSFSGYFCACEKSGISSKVKAARLQSNVIQAAF